jgi:hypothetical protein
MTDLSAWQKVVAGLLMALAITTIIAAFICLWLIIPLSLLATGHVWWGLASVFSAMFVTVATVSVVAMLST